MLVFNYRDWPRRKMPAGRRHRCIAHDITTAAAPIRLKPAISRRRSRLLLLAPASSSTSQQRHSGSDASISRSALRLKSSDDYFCLRLKNDATRRRVLSSCFRRALPRAAAESRYWKTMPAPRVSRLLIHDAFYLVESPTIVAIGATRRYRL